MLLLLYPCSPLQFYFSGARTQDNSFPTPSPPQRSSSRRVSSQYLFNQRLHGLKWEGLHGLQTTEVQMMTHLNVLQKISLLQFKKYYLLI
jgi:hypothetical protein